MPGRAEEFSPVPESDRACGFARRLCVEAPMKRQEIPAYGTKHLAGGGKSQRSSTNNRLWPVPRRAPIQISRAPRCRGSEGALNIPGHRRSTGGEVLPGTPGKDLGYGWSESPEPSTGNRRWIVPFIKRKNFGFFDPMVFNGIVIFDGEKGAFPRL